MVKKHPKVALYVFNSSIQTKQVIYIMLSVFLKTYSGFVSHAVRVGGGGLISSCKQHSSSIRSSFRHNRVSGGLISSSNQRRGIRSSFRRNLH
jgi:hypothetical protein